MVKKPREAPCNAQASPLNQSTSACSSMNEILGTLPSAPTSDRRSCGHLRLLFAYTLLNEPLRQTQPSGLHDVFLSAGLAGPGSGLEDSLAQDPRVRYPREDPRAGATWGSLGNVRGSADVGARDRDGQGRMLSEADARAVFQVATTVNEVNVKAN
jgi:hypothetical protein